MKIYFSEDESSVKAQEGYGELMEEALGTALTMEGLDPSGAEVSVSFVSPSEIQELNRDYRDTDRVTDVLSFPQSDSIDDLKRMMEMTGVMELGDVVICMDRAESQAEEYGHSLKREVIYLFVHSVLHLLGYDHMEEDEKKVMRGREEEIMEELDIKR